MSFDREKRGLRMTEIKPGAEKLRRSIVRAHPSQKARRMGHPQVQRRSGVTPEKTGPTFKIK